jgi:hypothetical protein
MNTVDFACNAYAGFCSERVGVAVVGIRHALWLAGVFSDGNEIRLIKSSVPPCSDK